MSGTHTVAYKWLNRLHGHLIASFPGPAQLSVTCVGTYSTPNRKCVSETMGRYMVWQGFTSGLFLKHNLRGRL